MLPWSRESTTARHVAKAGIVYDYLQSRSFFVKKAGPAFFLFTFFGKQSTIIA